MCTPVRQPLEPSQLLAQNQGLAISTIILPQNTYLVVLRPDGKIHRYSIAVGAEQFTKQIQAWRDKLEDVYSRRFLVPSQALYDLLIRPLEQDLMEIKPKTLVFINDRNLKNVPMAALYDGKQYLVEKYSIAVSLGLKLISQEYVNEEQIALTFGATKLFLLLIAIYPMSPKKLKKFKRLWVAIAFSTMILLGRILGGNSSLTLTKLRLFI
ncbi:MAG: CHAT domain-containing protein [Hydrococcus sp. RM1_1_31]|nr:CHAT domain-containing protein [Hydrococcus sp. RM1_1_31]